MAAFAVPRCIVLPAGRFRRPDVLEDCSSSGRADGFAFRVRAAAGSGGNSRGEDEQAERARKALESLDQQLSTLSGSNGRVPRKPQPFRTLPGPDAKVGGKIEWPELNDSFLLYSAGFLFVLTIVNNVLFNFIFKPDIQPKKPLIPTDTQSVVDEDKGKRRFRIRSFQDENESAESPVLTDSSP